MRRFALVACREYVENLRTKTFWIGILIFPLVLGLMVTVPRLLDEAKDERTYAVIDRSGWVLEAVESGRHAPDWEALLADAAAAARGDERVRDLDLPPALVGLGRAFAEVPEDQLDARVAEVAAALRRLDALPPEAVERTLPPEHPARAVLAARAEVHAWYRGLPPERAARWRPVVEEQRFRRVEADDDETALNRRIDAGELFAYFVIPEDVVDPRARALYVSENRTDDELRRWFSRQVGELVRERRREAHGIAPEVVAEIEAPVEFQRRQIDGEGEVTELSTADVARDYAPIAFVYMLWIAIFAIAQMLLTNTIEEKSNRIIEVLLSSISPLELMSGKIAGIAATGLTIVSSWILVLFVGIRYALPALGVDPGFDLSFILRDPVYLLSFAAYFLLGYLFFAAFLVGIGAVCNSLKEAQNLMTPVTVVLMLPLFAMFPVVQDPNGTLAKVLSFIPPLTPFIMMNRAAGPPSATEYVLTTLLLLASIAVTFWAAAKVFRIGILMTGKPPRLREILRWLRSPASQVDAPE